MTRREIAVLTYQLLAAAMFAYALVSLAPFIAAIARDFGRGRLWNNIGGQASSWLGAILWTGAAWWIRSHSIQYAERMFDDDEDEPVRMDVDESTLWSAGCALVGLFIALPQIKELANQLFYVALAKFYEVDLDFESSMIQFGYIAIELAVGSYLILGSHSLSRFLVRARKSRSELKKELPDDNNAGAEAGS